jgi:TetR/AcrR family transcriptional regulator, transcriptional repressor for nem operon
VDHVLERSGAGKSQFYHYFEGKQDLVIAVLDHRVEEDLDAIIEVQERLEFVACPIGTLAAERAEGDEALRPRLLQALRTKGEYLRRGLERMKAEGRLREDADPGRLVDFVTAVLQGALLLASVQKEREPLEAALDEAYRHLRSFAVNGSVLS